MATQRFQNSLFIKVNSHTWLAECLFPWWASRKETVIKCDATMQNEAYSTTEPCITMSNSQAVITNRIRMPIPFSFTIPNEGINVRFFSNNIRALYTQWAMHKQQNEPVPDKGRQGLKRHKAPLPSYFHVIMLQQPRALGKNLPAFVKLGVS